MKRKTNKVIIVLMILLVNITLSGCTKDEDSLNKLQKVIFLGEEIDKTNVEKKRSDELDISLKNTLDKKIYVDYEVKLFDDRKEVLAQKKYDVICFSAGSKKYINISDAKSDCITYSRIKYVEVKVNRVYEYNGGAIPTCIMSLFYILIVSFLFFCRFADKINTIKCKF